jgi:imidazolonepropionase-like amidohydrolase
VAIAYAADRIFDGTSHVAHDGGTVVVEGDRIVSVGPGRDVPDGVEILDLGDATLMPGLVDAHAHLIWDSSAAPEERVARESVAMTALRAAANAARHLAAGVTTVRDVGSTGAISVELARSIEQGVATGPRVIAAGRAITMTGGHVFQIGREADGPDAPYAARSGRS